MISQSALLLSAVSLFVSQVQDTSTVGFSPDTRITHAQPVGNRPTALEVVSSLPETPVPRTNVVIRCEFESYSKKAVVLPLVGPVYEVKAVYQCKVSSSAGKEVVRIKRRNLLRRQP